MVAPAWLPANQAEFEFQAGPYKDGELSVIGFSAEEALSQPFRLEAELVAKPETSIDTAKVIGAPALLTVNLANGSSRCLHGIVSQMSSLGAGAGPARRCYLATVVPQFWKLRHLQRSRVFQNLSIPEIVIKVLDQSGVKHRNALDTGKYKKRIYCVQYRESDFALVSRLLEEEGIFYWFEHQKDEHRMVLADMPSACKNIEGDATLVFREPTQMAHAADAVYAISQRREPQVLGGELVASGEAGASYHNESESIPGKVPYRPPRRTPRPLVYGAQTAIVVGPKGEEIYTDEHGRIKVQFTGTAKAKTTK